MATAERGLQVQWNSTGGTLFEENQVQARVECRSNLDVLRRALSSA